MALIALHHLVTVEDARVVVVASSRQQAEHLFGYAQRFARELLDEHVVHRHLVLRWCPDPGQPKVWTRSLEVWAADPGRLHGLTFSLAVVDELQAHQDAGVYVSMASALHKRPGAQLVVISTAGQGADSPLGVLRARALALPSVKRSGAVTDARGPSLRMLAWELDDDANVDDPRAVKRANPASWITVEQLRHAREALPDLAYRRFVGNQWTERAGHWLPPGAWQRIVGTPTIAAGEEIWIGVDVGGGGQEGDTAVAWLSEQLRVGVEVLEGEGAELDALDLIRELGARYRVREVAFDPWRASTIANVLEREGVTCTAFPQTDARMIPASTALHRAVVERRLCVPDHPTLAQHAANAVARQTRRGWRLDRPSRAAGLNIDAIIALAMAVDAAENQPQATELLGWL
jgi:phage terminase large subunit-like protein